MVMAVRANAMDSERKRMPITAIAAMDIMAPRVVACFCVCLCEFYGVFSYVCFFYVCVALRRLALGA